MTNEEEQNKIIEKVEKLLALAQSSNEHEAKLAATKASEILTTYNLTIEQLNQDKHKYITDCFFNGTKKSQETKYVLMLIQQFFFVRIIETRYFSHKHCKRMLSLRLVGTKANVKIAMQVCVFLTKTFEELWQAYRISHGAKVKQKQSYLAGLSHGLYIQLNEQKEACESKTGLMVIPDEKLKNFINEEMGVTSEKTPKTNIKDKEALLDGIVHGHQIRIQKGMEDKSIDRRNLLK